MMVMINVFKVTMVRKILKQVFGNSYDGGGESVSEKINYQG